LIHRDVVAAVKHPAHQKQFHCQKLGKDFSLKQKALKETIFKRKNPGLVLLPPKQ